MSESAPTHRPSSVLPWDLLDRYYAGQVSASERADVEAYLATRSPDGVVIEEMVTVLRQSDVPQSETAAQVPGMLAELHQRMQPRAAMKRLVHTSFGGSIELAVAALLDLADSELTESEVTRLRAAIQQAKGEGR